MSTYKHTRFESKRLTFVALPIASLKFGDTIKSEDESSSNPDLDSNSEYSSDSSEDSNAITKHLSTRERPPKIAVLMTHIQGQIKLLYHLDTLLRRPRLSGRYLKSTNENCQASLLEMYDYAHIEEKQRLWIRSFNLENEVEEQVQSENLPERPPRAKVYESWEDEPTVGQDVLKAREKSLCEAF